jgi:hypothetical protein
MLSELLITNWLVSLSQKDISLLFLLQKCIIISGIFFMHLFLNPTGLVRASFIEALDNTGFTV